MRVTVAACCVALLGSLAAAQAATVTQTIRFDVSASDTNYTNSESEKSYSTSSQKGYLLNAFDTSLGTLTNVRFTTRYNLEARTKATYVDTGLVTSVSGYTTAWASGRVTLLGTATSASTQFAGRGCSQSNKKNASCSATAYTTTSKSDIFNLGGQSIFDQVINGTARLVANVTGYAKANPQNKLLDDNFVTSASVSGRILGTTTVTYFYTPKPIDPVVSEVPLPAAGWLLGGALLWLGRMKHKARKLA